jgi:hypothetical protein
VIELSLRQIRQQRYSQDTGTAPPLSGGHSEPFQLVLTGLHDMPGPIHLLWFTVTGIWILQSAFARNKDAWDASKRVQRNVWFRFYCEKGRSRRTVDEEEVMKGC